MDNYWRLGRTTTIDWFITDIATWTITIGASELLGPMKLGKIAISWGKFQLSTIVSGDFS